MRWTENVGGGRVLRKGAPGPLRPPAKLRVSGDRHAIHLGSGPHGTALQLSPDCSPHRGKMPFS